MKNPCLRTSVMTAMNAVWTIAAEGEQWAAQALRIVRLLMDGLRFGAKHYYATSERDTFKALKSSFDLILNTVSANLDLDRYLSLLRVDGTLVSVGAPSQPDSFRAFSLIGGRRSMAGSPIGGLAETQEMLDFCAEHGVVPEIELIAGGEVGAAYDRVERSDVRYRFVIDVASIG